MNRKDFSRVKCAMNVVISSALVLFMSACGSGMSNTDNTALIPKEDKKSGKWGYVNEKGEEILSFKYDNADNFSEGFAKVTLNGSEIFINKEEQEFEFISTLSDGLRSVRSNRKFGFADTTGNVVIPVQYDAAGKFSEGLAPVLMTVVNPPLVAPITSYGYIDKTGKEVIPFQYDAATDFSEGLASVAKKGKGYGFIDKTGKEIIPLKYEAAFPFSDGLSKVWLKSKWGYIDKQENVIVPIKYDAIRDFSEGLAMVFLNKKCGYVDKAGKEVIPIKYGGARDFSEGLAMVTFNGMKGDFSQQYSYMISMGVVLPGIQGFGYIDKTGKEIIPMKYEEGKDFSEGLAAVKINGKWGFVDVTGKEVIRFEYEDAESFSEGKAIVKLKQKEFFIDRTGKEVQD